MASEAELADLFITLRAVNAPILEAFIQTGEAGEEMIAALAAQLGEFDAAVARTAESMAALRDGMAEAAGAASAGGAEAAGGAAAAGAGAAAGGAADAELTAEQAQIAANAAAEADLEAQIQAGYDSISAKFAEISASADAAAKSWSADFAAMANDTIALSDSMDAAAARVDAAWVDMAASEDAYDAKTAQTAAAQGTALGNFSGSMLKVGAAGAITAAAVVDMAAKFQSSTTRLVTSGGEAAGMLQTDQQGILALAGQVGYSADDLSSAMYKITSAGQSGSQALATLKASAQGAKTENADLTTVADAVSTAMLDYKGKIGSAADVTSKLVAATSQGKTNFQELAGAMSAILPKASAAHINFNEILGDLASMTQHGMSAQQASENLADAISHMQNPTAVMSKEMAALGLNSTQLSQNLGTKGLSGTLDQVAGAVQKSMGPGTTAVVLNMQNALKGLPPAVQQLSQQVLDGSSSWTDWNNATKDLPVTQRSQAQSFATLVNSMHTIGTEQLSGGQVMQTYAGAMAKATGDSASLNVALMLTGQNSGNTSKAISTVSKATADAKGNVEGWSAIQGTFNQKLSQAKDGLQAAAIQVGTKLLPYVTAIVGKIAQFTSWLAQNKVAASALAAVIGVLLLGGLIGVIGKLVVFGASMAKNVIAPVTGSIGFIKNLVGGFQGAESAAGTFGGKVASAMQGIGKAASATWSGISTAASATWSVIAKGATAAWSGISTAASASWSAISSGISAAWSGISSVVGSAFSAIASGARVLGATLIETVFPALVEAAVATWSFTVALLANPITWIVIAVIALGVAVYELITHWKQVSAFFASVWADVKAVFSAAWDFIKSIVSTIVNWVKGRFEEEVNDFKAIGSDIKNAVTGAWNAVKNAITNIVTSIVNWVKDRWTEQINDYKQLGSDIKNAAVTAWNDLKNWISGKVSDLVNGIKTEWNEFLTFWKNLGNNIASSAKTAWQNFITEVKAIPGQVRDLFSDAGKWLVDVGKDIITGLWNGITGALGWLWDKIKSIGQGIVSEFKSFLNIFSPSKTMADEVGQHIPTGIAQGIVGALPALQAAAKKAAATAVTGAQAGLGGSLGTLGVDVGSASAMAPAFASSPGAGVTVVHMPITVNGSVVTDTTLTAAMQKAFLQLSSRNVGFSTNVAFS